METIATTYRLGEGATITVSWESYQVIRAEYASFDTAKQISIHQVHDHDSGNHAAEVILEAYYGEGNVSSLMRRTFAISLQYMAETR